LHFSEIEKRLSNGGNITPSSYPTLTEKPSTGKKEPVERTAGSDFYFQQNFQVLQSYGKLQGE